MAAAASVILSPRVRIPPPRVRIPSSRVRISSPRVRELPRLLELWHVASLDAPTVATIWCAALADALHVNVSGRLLAALFAAVWAVYAGDRLLNVRRQAGFAEDPCHAFHRAHATAMWSGVGAAVVTIVVLLGETMHHGAAPGFLREGLLLLPMAGYMVMEHRSPAAPLRRWPSAKPSLIAVIFALGVTLPVAARAQREWLPCAAYLLGFAALAWLNLVTIAAGYSRRRTAFAPSQALRARVMLLLPAAAALLLLPHFPLAAALLLTTAALLALLPSQGERSPLAARILPDVLLLLPAVTLLPRLHF